MGSTELQTVSSRLLSLLEDNREYLLQAEKDRHFSPGFIEKVAETGFFTITLPRRYGGMEVEYEELLKLIVRVAMRSGSLAWCLMIMAQHYISCRAYGENALNILFAEKPLLLTTCFTPIGKARVSEDGYRLSGRWTYATGIHFANWVVVDAAVSGASENTVGKFVVAAKDFAIEDDWEVAGMRATGTCTVSLEDAQVAGWQCVSLKAGGAPSADKDMQQVSRKYRIPQRIMTGLGTVAPMVGMLWGMLDAAMPEEGSGRKTGSSLEEIAMRSQLMGVKANIEQTFGLFSLLAEEVTALTYQGEAGFDIRRQYSLLQRCAAISDRCCSLASELFVLSGTKCAYAEHPVGQRMIDIHVMGSHYLLRKAVINVNAALASLNA